MKISSKNSLIFSAIVIEPNLMSASLHVPSNPIELFNFHTHMTVLRFIKGRLRYTTYLSTLALVYDESRFMIDRTMQGFAIPVLEILMVFNPLFYLWSKSFCIHFTHIHSQLFSYCID